MRVEFTLTPNEVAEGIAPAAAPGKRHLSKGAIGLVVGGVVGVGVGPVILTLWTSNRPDLYDHPGLQNLWATVAPPAAFALWMTVAVMIGNAKKRRLARDPFESMHQSEWASLAMSLPLALLAVPLIPALCLQWRPTPFEQTLVAFSPYAGWVLGFAILARFRRRVGLHAQATTPSLARRHAVTFTDDGFHYSDGVIDQQAKWEYFRRARETKNLIVLINEAVMAVIVPKRAFADPSDVIAFKALLQAHVKRCDFVHDVTGFPVVPIGRE